MTTTTTAPARRARVCFPAFAVLPVAPTMLGAIAYPPALAWTLEMERDGAAGVGPTLRGSLPEVVALARDIMAADRTVAAVRVTAGGRTVARVTVDAVAFH